MNKEKINIRDAHMQEFESVGQLMVKVYAGLAGFPDPTEQPAYYKMLADIGSFTKKPATRLLVAVTAANKLLGGVVYFGDMQYYGSGGAATTMTNASGIRLLAVDPETRGQGIGKGLTQACIQLARDQQHERVLLHTTNAMQTAWAMYERMGFVRYPVLDFFQQELEVFGFQLKL